MELENKLKDLIKEAERWSENNFKSSRDLWKQGENTNSRYQEGISDGIDLVLSELKKMVNY